MNEVPRELQDALQALEVKNEPFSETNVSSAIKKACRQIEETGRALGPEARAEAMAFDFIEPRSGAENAWGTHFGPMMTWQNEDGTTSETPSIQDVTSDIIDYWVSRSRSTAHPVLQARYAGLAWDFAPTVTGERAPVAVAQAYVSAVIAIASGQAHRHVTDVFRKLEHALGVALSLNDARRVEQVRDAILRLEQVVAVDDKPGLWGYGFDLLLEKKKIPLDDATRRRIIDELEARLDRLCNPSSSGAIHPWAAQAAAQRLAQHYRRADRSNDVRRVLLKVGRAFGHIAKDANPMVAQVSLQQVHALYQHFGLSDAAAEVRKKIRDLGPAARNQLVSHSTTIDVQQDEMDAFVEAILAGGLEQAIKRLILHHIPRRKNTEDQLKQLAEQHASAFLTPITIMDHRGRPVASVGSLDADVDGHVVRQTTQNIGFSAIFLRRVIAKLISRYDVTVETVMSWLAESPIFATEKDELLRRGIQAYFDEDPVNALHLLVPQIEDAVREVLTLSGGDIYRPNRLGGMDVRPFDDLLRDEVVEDTLTSDVTEYLRILYTDRRGMNLRNRLSHGMLPAESINMALADRVFHTLVLLAQLRAAGGNEEPDSS